LPDLEKLSKHHVKPFLSRAFYDKIFRKIKTKTSDVKKAERKISFS